MKKGRKKAHTALFFSLRSAGNLPKHVELTSSAPGNFSNGGKVVEAGKRYPSVVQSRCLVVVSRNESPKNTPRCLRRLEKEGLLAACICL